MKKTTLNQVIRNLLICASAGGALVACGGSSQNSGGSAKLLGDGEACQAAWSSGAAYNGGAAVSRSGRNYTAAFWTQGQDPATNNGPAGSGQPWISGYLCGSTPTPTPTPTPAPTPTPTPAPTPTGSVTMYKDCNYSGTWSASFGPGSYHLSDIVAHGGLNDDASSMRVPAGYTVTLYQDDNFSGASVTLTSDNSCFVNINFNDMVSSMIVSSTSSPTPTPAPTPTPTPTPTPSCTYQTWTSGVNYALNTIVKYPANGNYYKEVNAGTNGSDGTDPTISTWYWSPTTCGSSPTPTPTPTPAGFPVSSSQFDQIFPPSGRSSFYTYQGFINAANSIAGFGTTGSSTVQAQEVAAFLANVGHETSSLYYVEEIDKSGNYCDASQSYGCPAGTYQYYGRGPLQISWNFNYKAAGDWMGTNLLASPGLVASDATITWKSAIWYWMTQNGPGTMTAHNAMVNSAGFGQTIRSINGSLECNGNNTAQMNDRVSRYQSIVNLLGVPAGSNLTC